LASRLENAYAYADGNPISGVDPSGLSTLYYSDNGGLQVYSAGDRLEASFSAANNTASNGRGPWPDGTYSYDYYLAHKDDANPNSSYRSNGIFIFNRPPCQGCGVHSGRANRGGPKAKTEGCIRPTDDATAYLKQLNAVDPALSPGSVCGYADSATTATETMTRLQEGM
jgi:hypothetical protein